MSIFTNKQYAYGKIQESKILPIIKDYFKRDIKQVEDKYSKWDFEDDEYIYELKSRLIKADQYPTTVIGANKKVDNSKKQIFIFNYIDQLKFIEYDEILFNKFEIKRLTSNYKETDFKNQLFIPIKNLNLIKKYI